MKRLGAFILCSVIGGMLLALCGCPTAPGPGVMSLTVNNGEAETALRTVTLNNVCTGTPSVYIASESSTFNETDWQTYTTSPSFTLAGGNGLKTVYFKVKNYAGESNVMTATITLNETSPAAPQAGETMTFAGIEFVWCPPGSYMMGSPSAEQDRNASEGPQHQVTLSSGFLLSKYPCTQAQWKTMATTNPSYFQGANANNANTDLRPVEQVSWNNAQLYITALNAAYPGMNFRLPTEAEWEYACRAGSTTRFYWGDDPNYTQIGDNVWFFDNSSQRTHAVGVKPPNAWGLYDMGGNVLNWVQDLYGTYAADPVTDPAGPATGSGRVARGGNWYSNASACRSASRYSSEPIGNHNFIGFRLARFLGGSSSTEQPGILSFTLNNGAVQTTSRTVTLNNVATGAPTEYIASESATFNEATWQVYGPNPSFTLAGGNAQKRVYLKVKNSVGESNVMTATITLEEASPAAPQPGETLTYAGMEFVWCAPGSFMMGSPDAEVGRNPSEGPQHQVTLTKGFLIAKYPCTQTQWYEITGETPSYFQGSTVSNINTANFPVEQVSWDDVQTFITSINAQFTDISFRLPTEAEWEYACRADTTTRFSWGDDLDYMALGDQAWYFNNSNSQTHDVGEKLPNPWGLYDMNGNVLNWVQDRFGSFGAAATDPAGPDTGSSRVTRGGCWYGGGNLCRSAIRYSNNPASSYNYIGFRLASSEKPVITEETILLPGDVPLVMVWIPEGTFMMGATANEQDSNDSERPRHQVTLQGFWMGKYPVTKRQWIAVMGTTPWTGKDFVIEDLESPAIYISWDRSQQFITALNSYTGLTFRMPSESQREYATRAGTTTRFYWGDDPNYTQIDRYSWNIDNAWYEDEQYAHIVGLKLPNLFGLYDMSGNVYEWCQDWLHDDYTGAPTDGSAWETPVGTSRVYRGGGWDYHGRNNRSAYRGYRESTFPSTHIGIRLVK